MPFVITNAFKLMTDNKNRNAKVQCALFKGTTRDILIWGRNKRRI